MFTVAHQSGHVLASDAGEALKIAICSAVEGRGCTVTDHGGKPVWEIEVDTKVDDADAYFPVIVHFRGHSLEPTAAGRGSARDPKLVR